MDYEDHQSTATGFIPKTRYFLHKSRLKVNLKILFREGAANPELLSVFSIKLSVWDAQRSCFG